MKKYSINKITLSAMFLATGMVLPLITGQIKEIGDTLLPMHLPVLLCGFFCGGGYGFATGLLLPFVRSAIFSMPPIYPNAVWMAFELAVYGFASGFMYGKVKYKNTGIVYLCLIVAMVSGRIVWGIAKAVLLGIGGKAFTASMFIAGAFTDAIPGIILQLVLIPPIVNIYAKYRNR